MPFSINFAYHLTKQRSKEQAQDRSLFKKAVVVGIIAVALTTASVLARLSFDVALAVVKNEEKKVLAQLESLKAQELAYVGYVSKVNVLSELFQNRQAKQQALKKFRSLFESGVSITGLNYAEDSNDLEFRLKTASVFVLERVVAQLDDPQLRTDYKDIVKENVSRAETGNYDMSISVNLQIVSPTPTPESKSESLDTIVDELE